MGALHIENINKIFGKTQILHDLSLSIGEGEFVVLVGPSGCGKSTLLNIIAGLEEPSYGSIFINEKDVTTLHPSKRDIAMVFQSYALYPNMTVAQNIAFGLEMRGVDKSKRQEAVQEVARTLQIENLLERKPKALSGGQRQRVAMGRAIVRQPGIYLFDEPLSNLDAKLRVDMRTEMKRLHRDLGTTTVYVTHDQIEALTLATRIVVMKGGVVQQIGTPNQIYNDPQNMFTAGFMGAPSMNFIKGKVSGAQGEPCFESADGEQFPLPPHQEAHKDQLGGELIFGIRPENIMLARDVKEGDMPQMHRHEAVVEILEMAGSDTFVVFSLGQQECIARIAANTKLTLGEKVEFAFNMEYSYLFNPQSDARI